MIKKIAVIGATGMLGKPVTRALVSAGFEVTAFVRDESVARKLLPSGITFMKGDLKDPSSIGRLLKDQDAPYINLHVKQDEKENGFHTESDGLANVVAAARKTNLQRIAMLSSIVMRYQGMNGFDWWVFRVKHLAVKLIKESGIPYTIFYASAFMECFHYVYRRGNKVLLAGTPEHKMYFIAADDYAMQVVNSFKTTLDGNKEYVVQGPEAFTADDAAKEFIEHYKKEKISISRAPLGLFRFLARFSVKISYACHIIEALNKYPEKFEAENTWRELGKAETTLRVFAGREI